MVARIKLRLLGCALALACVSVLALGTSPAAARANPLEGNGMWIWYVSRAGGSAGAIASKANARDVGTVFVKSGDAGNYWEQFSSTLVNQLHAAGLQVCAWQFVYGGSPATEAAVGAQAVQRGADCLVIDAESHYEGRYAAADRYIEELRDRIGPDYPVVLTSFPYVDFHPAFPYSVFLAPGAAQYNQPQIYWHTIGDSVRGAFSHTFRFNRPYDAPIFPLGQTYDDPPKKELVQFRQYASEYGATGVSWWSWQHTGKGEWRRISKPISGDVPGFEAKIRYPVLSEGAAGDLVVLAQQLLRAYGFAGEVDGTFGSGTEADVLGFQAEHGLPATGAVDAATWRKLLERDPVRTRWSERSTRGPGPPPAPESAALEALDYELPTTAGLP